MKFLKIYATRLLKARTIKLCSGRALIHTKRQSSPEVSRSLSSLRFSHSFTVSVRRRKQIPRPCHRPETPKRQPHPPELIWKSKAIAKVKSTICAAVRITQIWKSQTSFGFAPETKPKARVTEWRGIANRRVSPLLLKSSTTVLIIKFFIQDLILFIMTQTYQRTCKKETLCKI